MTDKNSRKKPGEGSYNQNPVTGKVRWRANITYPDGTSERRTGTARNMTEARREVRKAREQAEQGVQKDVRHLTIDTIVQDHMAAKEGTWAYRTTMNNQDIYDRHIKKELGSLKAAGVTPARLREYYDTLGDRGLGYSGQNQISALLSGAYKYAIERGRLSRNPTKDARPRRPQNMGRVKKFPAFSRDQAQRFLEEALKESWGWPLGFMLFTGVRIGEAVGLKWEDVNVEKDGTVAVNIKVTRSEFKGRAYENTPKTDQSTRVIYLQPEAARIIDIRRERAGIEADFLGQPQSEYVFTSMRKETRGGEGPKLQLPMRHDTIRHVMLRICDRAGVPRFSPHKLRHTCASLLAEQGLGLEIISKHLGHAQVSTTVQFYRQVYKEELKKMVIKFDDPGDSEEE